MATCTERPTEIKLTPANQKAGPNSNVVFKGALQNKDSRGCAATTFAVRATLSCASGLDGKTTSKITADVPLKPAQKVKEDLSVFVGPNQKPGDVIEVTLSTFRGTSRTPSGSASGTITVE